MAAPLYRSVKGQALTAVDYDENTRSMYEHDDGIIVPKTQGTGVLIDPAAPDFGWHDLKGDLHFNHGDPTSPTYELYNGNVRQLRFDVNDEAFINFHMPHDYLMGSVIHIHVHWSHNSLAVTSGAPTFILDGTYSKAHNQAAFGAPVSVVISENASTTRFQHMTTEVPFSAALGAGGLIPTEDLEVDGLILLRCLLSANTMDGGALPFIHFVDIHYQSTGLPTKNRAPDFWT